MWIKKSLVGILLFLANVDKGGKDAYPQNVFWFKKGTKINQNLIDQKVFCRIKGLNIKNEKERQRKVE